MTKDEYQVQVSLGLVNRKILNNTTDTELLKAVVDYTVPDQERRLDLGWLVGSLYSIKKRQHSVRSTVVYVG